MYNRFVEAFVDKLILLERRTGASVHYRIMPPFTTPFYNYLSLQKTARDIGDFIGLTNYNFIISVARQKKNVAANIDLSTQDKDVFIDISPETMKFPEFVGATLCHEITHKWLQINGIRSHPEIDNEILTDITTVFLGFGKIMLNGCKIENVRHENIPNGTRTITETQTVGYLDRDQLAFVYRLVCAMRKIPSSDYMRGLNAEAAHAVRICDSSFGHYYAPHFHKSESSQHSVNVAKSKVIKIQYILANLDKHMNYIRKSFCETVDVFLKDTHKKLESLRQNTISIVNETPTDPVLRFLQSIKVEFEIDRLNEQIYSMSKEAESFLSHAREIGRLLSLNGQLFPPPSKEMFNIVVCPQDGTKLRLPENSGNLIVTCPTCKYSFAYNTNVLSFSEHTVSHKLSWWQKIRNLMRRKITS